jgi:hypothetical protein
VTKDFFLQRSHEQLAGNAHQRAPITSFFSLVPRIAQPHALAH